MSKKWTVSATVFLPRRFEIEELATATASETEEARRLIAAAPDLLEALKLNLREQERMSQAEGLGDTPGILMARSAIARAEKGA